MGIVWVFAVAPAEIHQGLGVTKGFLTLRKQEWNDVVKPQRIIYSSACWMFVHDTSWWFVESQIQKNLLFTHQIFSGWWFQTCVMFHNNP